MSSRRPHIDPRQHRAVVDYFLSMYAVGAFPMADPPSVRQRGQARSKPREPEINWYRPDPRAILPLNDGALRIWDGLRKARRKKPFVFTADACFTRVISECAAPGPGRGGTDETWLCPSLIACYTLLHEHHHAHSIEAWLAPDHPAAGGFVATPPESATLVGGIYGVSIGAAFFAESMFSRPAHGGTNASSLCLVMLWNHLRACGYELLDVQIANHHTRQFGVVDISADDYLKRLEPALAKPDAWRPPTA